MPHWSVTDNIPESTPKGRVSSDALRILRDPDKEKKSLEQLPSDRKPYLKLPSAFLQILIDPQLLAIVKDATD